MKELKKKKEVQYGIKATRKLLSFDQKNKSNI
jgi:hypothetical protein